MGCELFPVALSLHPQKRPGVSHVVEVVVGVVEVVLVEVGGGVTVGVLTDVVVFGSLQPNHPGVLQVL